MSAKALAIRWKGNVMSSLNTMQLIGETFIALTESTSPEKISISDIVSASGKNRKTFYYHFADKNALVAWIFRRDLGTVLTNRFEESLLVYEPERSKDGASSYPFYLFAKRGVRSLDHAAFFEAFADCIESRRRFYAKVLRDTTPDGLREYLHRLYVPALRDDVRFILSNRYLKEENVTFLAEFYTGAFLSYFFRRTLEPPSRPLRADIGPFANIVHTSLENVIKEQQLSRIL